MFCTLKDVGTERDDGMICNVVNGMDARTCIEHGLVEHWVRVRNGCMMATRGRHAMSTNLLVNNQEYERLHDLVCTERICKQLLPVARTHSKPSAPHNKRQWRKNHHKSNAKGIFTSCSFKEDLPDSAKEFISRLESQFKVDGNGRMIEEDCLRLSRTM